MRLDSLVRLIESSDFMAFRELAIVCLKMKGYSETNLTDGWKDGGTDVRVHTIPPNPTRMAIAISVQRDWKSKLKSDANKVRSNLGLDDMTYVTSRRIPEAEFHTESNEIWKRDSIRVTKMDSQAIASTFFTQGKSTTVLTVLGIDLESISTIPIQFRPRDDAIYSYVFFGQDPTRFREEAIDSCLVSIAAREDNIERSRLEQQAAQALGFQENQMGMISAAVDRMFQDGRLTGPNRSISASSVLRDATKAMYVLRYREWTELRKNIEGFLNTRTKRPVKENEMESVISDVGALLLESANNTLASLRGSADTHKITENIKKRLKHLNVTLDTIGISDGANRDQTLVGIAEIASHSPVGKHLLAGELFVTLSATGIPQLIQALGGRSQLEVLLDASVAIPMLCGLLYRRVENRYSISAMHAYDQIMIHDLSLVLPKDYLEETAAHLLQAARDYVDIVDLDPDLASSENSYVAHFVSMKNEGVSLEFQAYIG